MSGSHGLHPVAPLLFLSLLPFLLLRLLSSADWLSERVSDAATVEQPGLVLSKKPPPPPSSLRMRS